jgi:hypothetical protein
VIFTVPANGRISLDLLVRVMPLARLEPLTWPLRGSPALDLAACVDPWLKGVPGHRDRSLINRGSSAHAGDRRNIPTADAALPRASGSCLRRPRNFPDAVCIQFRILMS